MQELGRTLKKHWILALAGALFVLCASVFYTFSQTRIFRSSATLQIEPSSTRPLGNDVQSLVDLGGGSYWANQDYYLTQYKIIQSRTVAEQTVRRLHLDSDAGFLAGAPHGVNAPAAQVPMDVAVDRVISATLVEPIKDSRLVRVKFDDPDPERAQRVLTTLIEVYRERNIDQAQQFTNSGADWLAAQMQELKDRLDKSERALHDYKSGKQMLSLSLDDKTNMLREEIGQLNTSLTQVKTRREAVAAQVAELGKIDATDPINLPSQTLLDSTVLQTLRARYLDAKSERDALLAEGKGSLHPEVVALQAKIETARQALLSEISNVQAAARAELATTERELQGLGRLYADAEKRALELNLIEIDYHKLERTKANTERLYSMVLERTTESDLARKMRFNNIQLVEEATLPRGPVTPRIPLNLAIGLFGGLAFGLALALGRETLDSSLKSTEDVEQYLGLPFLGVLPRIGDSTRWRRRARAQLGPVAELAVHSDSKSAVAEAARAIRTNILFSSPDRPPRSLLITSSGPEEGKTTVATSLAVVMAQAGQRVLLVDCDLRRPRMHRIFSKLSTVGVTTTLLEPGALDAADLSCDVPGLDVLPAGPIPPNPAEIFHSEAFRRLLSQLCERYDRVILDSPPVGPVTDATILSTLADATLLVVRSHRTDREAARRSLRTLRDVTGNTILGAVMNDQRNHDRYGYPYYYTQPTSSEPQAPQPPAGTAA